MPFFKKSLLLKGIIFSSFFLLAGCALFSGRPQAFEQAGSSPSGLSLEQVLPDNVFLLAEFNLLNAQQKSYFEKFKKFFPQQENEKTFEKKITESINEQIKPYGLTYEADLKPLLTDNERYVLAMAPNSNAKKADNYVSAIIKDPKKFDEVLEKVSKSGNEKISLEEYKKNKILLNSDTELFITRLEDLAVSGKGLWAAKEMIDRAENKKNTLSKSNAFKKIVENLPSDRLAFLFINIGQMLNNLEGELKTKALSSLPNQELSKITDLEGLTLVANDSGLKFFGQYIAKEDSKINYNDFSGRKYLYKEIPGENILFLFEGAKLNTILKTLLENTSQEGSASTYEQIKQTLQKYNLDLEKDILSWLDKGFILSVHDYQDQIIPGISLVIDASDNPKKAEDFVRILDAQIAGLLMMLQSLQGGELSSLIGQKEVDLGGAKLKSVILSLDKLSQLKNPSNEKTPAPAPLPALQNQQLQIIYGLTKENKFIISTYQGWEKNYGKNKLDSNKEYNQVADYLQDADEGLIFVDTPSILYYADKLVLFMATMQQSSLTEEMTKSYNDFKSYLIPLKSIILSYRLEKKSGESRGFIRIGK